MKISKIMPLAILLAAGILYSFSTTKTAKTSTNVVNNINNAITVKNANTPKANSNMMDTFMDFYHDTGVLSIGSTDLPTGYRLVVKDGILTEKIRVAVESSADWAPWPDYVFEEDYQKLTLTELTCYLENEKHLPHVPSANEVTEKGVDLMEMDAAILKSVEELYLYTLELNKENDALKATIESLTKRIEKLEQE